MHSNDVISEEESYRLAYNAFLKAVRLLGQDPSTQCRVIGDFNVAWELKCDGTAGEQLLGHPAMQREIRAAIRELLARLHEVPDSVLGATGSPSENLVAMNHESWVSVRRAASEVLSAARNESDWFYVRK